MPDRDTLVERVLGGLTRLALLGLFVLGMALLSWSVLGRFPQAGDRAIAALLGTGAILAGCVMVSLHRSDRTF